MIGDLASRLFSIVGGDRLYPKTQELIERQLQQGVYPGVVYCLLDKEKQLIRGLGYAKVEPQLEKMSLSSLFDVASLTKVVCTTTVMLKLLEKGKIFLDDPLQQYLPSFQDGSIRLRHLLTHTLDIVSWIDHRDQLGKEELKQAYLSLQAGDKLGKEVKYTDSGMILLGFMLEEIYHKNLTEIFRQEVLDPLQMSASTFPPVQGACVVGTQRGTPVGQTHDPKARILAEHAGNAGLFTTVSDLLCFVHMYFDPSSILKRQTILGLLHDYTCFARGHRSLGWDLKEHDQVLFHTGYTGTFLAIDPKRKQAFIFLSNRIHPFDHREAYIKERDRLIECYLGEKMLY